jgi:hypothetical protein
MAIAFVIGPVVNDPPQEIGVGRYRDFRKKVAPDAFHAVMQRRFCNHLRLVEQDPLAGRMRVENVQQLSSDPASNVCNHWESAPLEGGSHGGSHGGAQVPHRLVEDRTLLWIGLKVLPRGMTVQLVKAWAPVFQSLHQPAPPVEEHRVRTESHAYPRPLRARSVSAQALARRRIGEYPSRQLSEDPRTLQRPEHSEEAGRISFGALGEDIDVHRARGQ